MMEMGRRLRLYVTALVLLGTFPAAFVARHLILGATITICPFKLLTGRPCIFCGLTRAFAHATHGELGAAFAVNPLWWAAALLLIIAGVSCLVAAFRRSPTVSWLWRLWKTPAWKFVASVVVASLFRALFAQGDL